MIEHSQKTHPTILVEANPLTPFVNVLRDGSEIGHLNTATGKTWANRLHDRDAVVEALTAAGYLGPR